MCWAWELPPTPRGGSLWPDPGHWLTFALVAWGGGVRRRSCLSGRICAVPRSTPAPRNAELNSKQRCDMTGTGPQEKGGVSPCLGRVSSLQMLQLGPAHRSVGSSGCGNGLLGHTTSRARTWHPASFASGPEYGLGGSRLPELPVCRRHGHEAEGPSGRQAGASQVRPAGARDIPLRTTIAGQPGKASVSHMHPGACPCPCHVGPQNKCLECERCPLSHPLPTPWASWGGEALDDRVAGSFTTPRDQAPGWRWHVQGPATAQDGPLLWEGRGMGHRLGPHASHHSGVQCSLLQSALGCDPPVPQEGLEENQEQWSGQWQVDTGPAAG